MEIPHFLFGIFGNVTALSLFLSPILTFRRIIKKKTTEEFSGVPYNMTLLNCLLSAWYGMPFVSPNNMLVWTINGTGAVIETVYVLIFLVYTTPRIRLRILAMFLLVWSVFGIVVLVSMLVLHGKSRKLFSGVASTIFSIIMYGSPLSIMSLVIRTKSVEFMPFFLSLFAFLCGTSWFIFGLLGGDPFVWVPNGCGSALGALQLILYAIYRKNMCPAVATEVEIEDQNLHLNGMENGEVEIDDQKLDLNGLQNGEKKTQQVTVSVENRA